LPENPGGLLVRSDALTSKAGLRLSLRHYAFAGAVCFGAVVMAFGAARAEDMKTPGALASGGLLADCATPASTPLRPCICTREYKPVCGRTPGGAALTYSNACMARCAGAAVVRSGRC
jgi:hypothetical protein